MKGSTFLALAAVTTLAVAAAGVAVALRPAPNTVAHDGAFAFPGLGERVESVAAITVEHPSGAFSMRRTEGGGWAMGDLHDYPVPLENVRKLVLGLADLRLFEAKTKRSDRYPRLEVEDVTAEGAKSRLVTLSDAAGETLARTIIGKRKNNLFGFRRDGTYLRMPEDDQAWLAEGAVRVETDPIRWLQQEIISIPMGDVRSMVLRQPDGQELRVAKTTRDANDFTLESPPEGVPIDEVNFLATGLAFLEMQDVRPVDEVPRRVPIDQSQVNFLATGLAFLEMQDVRPVDGIEFPADPHRATYTSFDGVIVNAEVIEQDGKFWGRFTVDYDAAAAAPAIETPAPEEDEEEATPSASPAELAAEVAARVDGWVFEIPDFKAAKLQAGLDDLVKEEPEEPS